MAEWQPIEIAPQDGTAILCIWRWQPIDVKILRKAWVDEQGVVYATPTHWMPLPEPPKSA